MEFFFQESFLYFCIIYKCNMMKKITIFFFLFVCFIMTAHSQPHSDEVEISKDLRLIRLKEGIYQHISYIDIPQYGRFPANGMVVTDGKEAILFDTPWNDSLTSALYHYLTSVMDLKIIAFVPNHWHEDCMGGVGFLKKHQIVFYASEITGKIAEEQKLPVPDVTFRDSLELRVGETAIWLYFPGPAHSKDNIVAWIPGKKVLFAGCMLKSLASTDLGNIEDGDLTAYPKTIDFLISKFKSAEIVIPGHGSVGGLELIKYTKELLKP